MVHCSTSSTGDHVLPAGSQNEEIVMLHNSFCLAVWRLPAAPPAAMPSSAAAAASASSPAPSSAACPPDAAASCSNPAAHPATAVFYIHRGDPGSFEAHGQTQTACTAAGSTAVTDQSDAVLLAFTKPRFRAYSITRSPDGRFVAIGKVAVAGGRAQSMCRCMHACLLDGFADCTGTFASWASVICLATTAYIT
jgi:hypothetical protein